MRAQYSPPPFDQAELTAKVFDHTKTRKQRKGSGALTEPALQTLELVRSYVNWWIISAQFKDKRIVCTGPIWLVRRIHSSPSAFDMVEFARGWVGYCGNPYPKPSSVMSDTTDNEAILYTAHALGQMFDDPGLAWEPLMKAAEDIKQERVVILRR